MAFVTPLPGEDGKVVAAVALEKFLDIASTGATSRNALRIALPIYLLVVSADMRPPASGSHQGSAKS